MANPSNQRPFAIEVQYNAGEKWYAVEAFRTEAEANEMLPVYNMRVAKYKASAARVRDTREPQQ